MQHTYHSNEDNFFLQKKLNVQELLIFIMSKMVLVGKHSNVMAQKILLHLQMFLYSNRSLWLQNL